MRLELFQEGSANDYRVSDLKNHFMVKDAYGPESLSSLFIDGGSSCGFFDIILQLYIRVKKPAFGRLVGRFYYCHTSPKHVI